MKRRTFLPLPVIGLAMSYATVLADEGGYVAYSREAYDKAMSSGEPLMLDFYAHW